MKRRQRRSYRKSYGLGSVARTANSALKLARAVSEMVDVEYKNLDTRTTLTAVTTAGGVVLLNDIDQGNDSNNREGRQVKAKQVYIKGYCVGSTNTNDNMMRVMLVLDCDNQGSNPAVSDILTVPGTYHVYSHKNTVNRKRFVILWDRTYELENGRSEQWEIYKKVSYKLDYSSATGTDTTNNALFLVYISNDSTNTPEIAYNSRLTYIDN